MTDRPTELPSRPGPEGGALPASVPRGAGRSPVGGCVSAVVVTHNSRQLIGPCLESLLETAGGLLRDLVVVDNLSDDGSADLVRERFPEARLRSPEVRSGYASNVNLGLRGLEGSHVLVANPDLVFQPGAVQVLAELLEESPDVGIAAPKLVNPDGSLQLSCRRWHTPLALALRRGPWARRMERSRPVRRFMMADWDHAEARDVDWVLGACMLVRRRALEEVGPMDPRFFLYFEDVDWCLRMQKAGWRVVYHPGAVVVHHHRQASQGLLSPAARHHLRSLLLYLAKHRGRLGLPARRGARSAW